MKTLNSYKQILIILFFSIFIFIFSKVLDFLTTFNCFYLIVALAIFTYFFYTKKLHASNHYKILLLSLLTTFSHLSGAFIGKVGVFTSITNLLVDEYNELKSLLPIFNAIILGFCLKAPIAAIFIVIEMFKIKDIKVIFKIIVSNIIIFLMYYFIFKVNFNHHSVLSNISFNDYILGTLVVIVGYLIIKFVLKLCSNIDDYLWFIILCSSTLLIIHYVTSFNINNINKTNILTLMIIFLLTNLSKLKGGIVAPSMILGNKLISLVNPYLSSFGSVLFLSLMMNYRYSSIILLLELCGLNNVSICVMILLLLNIVRGCKKV